MKGALCSHSQSMKKLKTLKQTKDPMLKVPALDVASKTFNNCTLAVTCTLKIKRVLNRFIFMLFGARR